MILTDSGRIPGTGAEVAAAVQKLQILAARPDVSGAVVDLSDPGLYPRVAFARTQADANPGCPTAKNILAAEIKKVIDTYRNANDRSIQYVVLAGGADVIPYRQVQDVAGLASERDYVPPVASNTPSEAGLRLGLVAGQDYYGSDAEISVGSGTLAVPALAVGRLVDSATDITAAVDAYIATNGIVTPRSSLVTGYDFVGDAAQAVKIEADAATQSTAETLIQPPGEAPNGPNAWTAAQLRTKLLAGGHDMILLSGHFSAGSLLAADYKSTLTAAEIGQSATNLARTVVVALGCHSGYAIPNADLLGGSSPDPDWAKMFLRKGSAGFIASTGYAYGDTEFTEYGERLVVGVTQQMRTGTGPIALGTVLTAAKRAYLSSTPQLSGIDEKTLVEMTLYGLPMMKVDFPGSRLTPSTSASIVGSASPVPSGPGASFGLSSATKVLAPTATQRTRSLTNLSTGANTATTYYLGRDGFVVRPFEPVLPKQIDNVSVAGQILRGVALRGGAYTDANAITPLTSSPNTETSGPSRSFSTDGFYPNQTWMPNYFDTINGGPTRLITFPTQFRSTGPGATDGTVRKFASMDLSFYYLPETWTATASSPEVKAAAVSPGPRILGTSARQVGNTTQVKFSASVDNDGSAGVQSVWVLYTGIAGNPLHGTWAPLDLVREAASPSNPTPDTSLWSGTLNLASPGDAAGLRFMVQAVNGSGLTALSTNAGSYYSIDPTTTIPPVATAVAFVANPGTGAFQHPVAFTARVTPASAGRVIVFDLGGQQVSAATAANGEATASITPVVPPGSYTVHATVRADSAFDTSVVSAPFAVVRDATVLSLSPTTSTIDPGQANAIVASLRDSTNRPLGGKSVAFVVSGNGQQLVRPVIADHWGDASLGLLSLPAGTYTVTAFFAGGQSVLVADENYTESQSAPVTLNVSNGTPPSITATAANADATAYTAGTWTKQNVVVHFSCTDAVAIATCTTDQTVSAEGTTSAIIGTATNTRGQSTSASFGPIRIDRSGPTVTVAAPAEGATYPSGSNVTADYLCSDPGAGPGSCAGPVANGARFDTSGTGSKTFVVNATDSIGNASSRTVTYNVSPAATLVPIVKADMGFAGLEEVGFPTELVGVTGTFSDPESAGKPTVSVRWKAGGSFSPLVLSNSNAFVAANTLTKGTYVVTIRVCNALGHCGTDDLIVRSKADVLVTPVRECVTDLGQGAAGAKRYRARFGYDNAATYAIVLLTLPLPAENIFTTAPFLRGQPQLFLPGNRRNVFTTDFAAGESPTWRLNKINVTATSSTPRC